jgi:alkylation response protein AidB-like acyl-CoA dehydrogenase
MDLSLTGEQEMLKNSAREFLEKEAPRTVITDIDDSETGFSPELWKKMAELGWAGLLIPEAYGGLGSDLLTTAVLHEELGHAAVHTPLHSSAVLSALALMEGGSDAQKEQYLPGIASGERIFAFAFTEPNYGWSPEHVQVQAQSQGGGYVLNGTKLFVPDAQVADNIIVVARTAAGNGTGSGLTAFVVDKTAPGVTVRDLGGFTAGRLCEVTFENAQVPAANVIGQAGQAWSFIGPVIDKATLVTCAQSVGGAQAAFEITQGYVTTRIQFGVPIGTFQRVQDFVIDLVNHLDGSRWTTYEAIWKSDAAKPGIPEAVSVAKIAASEGFHTACNDAHRAHGGIGISKRYGLYLYTKASRSLYSYLGDPVYHRKRLVSLLGL